MPYTEEECLAVCEGAWYCEDISIITEDFVAFYSTDGDDFVDYNDEISEEHVSLLMDACDYNQDGTVSKCEVFDCVVACENAWRDEYCPNSEHLYCANPYEPCPTCEGVWTCDDMANITLEVM